MTASSTPRSTTLDGTGEAIPWQPRRRSDPDRGSTSDQRLPRASASKSATRSRWHREAIDRAFAFTGAIQLLIAIVTVVGILDLLLSAIIERRHELALWRVVGADRGAVRRSVVLEACTLGILGALLGIAVGFGTAWIWVGVNLRYLLGYYLEYTFAARAAAQAAVLVLAMAATAGYAAATRATRAPVLEGIHHE
jgi:putative ABC transport system permease protein